MHNQIIFGIIPEKFESVPRLVVMFDNIIYTTITTESTGDANRTTESTVDDNGDIAERKRVFGC